VRHTDQYAAIFWFLFGAGITASSFYYGVGSPAEPGPGFITFLAGVGLTLLSLILLILSGRVKERLPGLRQLWEGRRTQKVLYILGLLVVYMLLVTPVGFLIVTFVLLLFLFRVQGNYSLRMVAFLSAMVTVISFIVFDQWLGVQLPRGFLGYFLF
jgi:putative tricarboxylic transport membrane protein